MSFMSTVQSRASSRLGRQQRPSTAATAAATKRSTGSEPCVRWQLDANGRITNFDMSVLRKDILCRLDDSRLYTLEECRVFLLELTRVAAAWQEEEFPCLMHLADLHERLLPGVSLGFQWPPGNAEPVPLAGITGIAEGALPMIAKIVEEVNRAVVRMIDQLWESRRQRLLFAARLLHDIEPLLQEVKGGVLSG